MGSGRGDAAQAGQQGQTGLGRLVLGLEIRVERYATSEGAEVFGPRQALGWRQPGHLLPKLFAADLGEGPGADGAIDCDLLHHLARLTEAGAPYQGGPRL